VKENENINIALIGNPNSGKSSVFNQLTGLHQKIGNFAGVTVDKKIGHCTLDSNTKIKIIDFPGTYSLYPSSADERVALDVLLNKKNIDFPNLIVYVLDANQIEKHTLLLTQLLDLDFKIIVAINMLDIARKNTLAIDVQKFSNAFKVSVVEINGRTGENIDKLKNTIATVLDIEQEKTANFYQLSLEEETLTNEISNKSENNYHNLLEIHHVNHLSYLSLAKKNEIKHLIQEKKYDSIGSQLDEIMQRYNNFVPKLQNIVSIKIKGANTLTDKIDNIITHKTYGVILFFVLMFIIFQAIFSWSAIPMEFIDLQFANLSTFLSAKLSENIFSKLLIEGIIPGISGIIIFVPQIFILFLILSFLEDIGYMSRAIYLFDSVMQKFGLNGRSIVSLVSGGACAVPAIMSTRTINNWKERLITILVTPFISCSARIPVFALLIAFVVPNKKILGYINLQGIVFMCLYLLGIIAALGSAYILKKIIKGTENSFLLLELPSYKTPHWKNILMEVWNKVSAFIFGAGKIIIIISIILWFLASFGPQLKQKEIQFTAEAKTLNLNTEETTLYVSSKKLENSYAGILGRSIEPIIQPLGFDWKIGIALITSFAAREVFIGTISTLYSVGKDANNSTIQEKLRNEINPETKQPVFTMSVAFSLIIFYLFAMQCMSTLAVVYKETKSWKYPLLQFTYMSILAYISSFIVYQFFK
jgi:ferrous iron transport protein B